MPQNKLTVLVLARYGNMGASSRLRLYQYLNFICCDNFNFVVNSLVDDSALTYRYIKRRYSFFSLVVGYARRVFILLSKRHYDLIFVEKEAFPWVPFFFEKTLLGNRNFVLDYDDAVFHAYDQHNNFLIRHVFQNKLKKLILKSSLTLCGSAYLADYARKTGSTCVEMLPTVIDLSRYPLSGMLLNNFDGVFRICWIGSPSTVQYLNLISDPLRRIALRIPFVLRVIGANFRIPGVKVECYEWTESSEVKLISECDIGVMPLALTNWELGKCGYKLIQYMACCLPVVATDFGANSEIVEHRVSGFLVQTDDEWESALSELLCNDDLRQRMGEFGRIKVEAQYCIQVTGSKMSRFLRRAAECL